MTYLICLRKITSEEITNRKGRHLWDRGLGDHGGPNECSGMGTGRRGQIRVESASDVSGLRN